MVGLVLGVLMLSAIGISYGLYRWVYRADLVAYTRATLKGYIGFLNTLLLSETLDDAERVIVKSAVFEVTRCLDLGFSFSREVFSKLEGHAYPSKLSEMLYTIPLMQSILVRDIDNTMSLLKQSIHSVQNPY